MTPLKDNKWLFVEGKQLSHGQLNIQLLPSHRLSQVFSHKIAFLLITCIHHFVSHSSSFKPALHFKIALFHNCGLISHLNMKLLPIMLNYIVFQQLLFRSQLC